MEKVLTEVFNITKEEYKKYDFLIANSVELLKEESKMMIKATANGFISQLEIDAIKKEISDIYDKKLVIDIDVTFMLGEDIDKEVFIEDYFKWLKAGLKAKRPIMYAMLINSNMKIEDNKIIFNVTPVQKNTLEGYEFTSRIIKDLKKKYDIDMIVDYNIVEKTEELNRALKDEEQRALRMVSNGIVVSGDKAEAAPKPPKVEKPKQEYTRRESTKDESGENPDIIMGPKIKEGPTKIAHLESEEGAVVVVQGEHFSMESRELKNEKILVTFFLSDLTNSVTVKCFVSKEKFPDIKAGLKESSHLKIKGTYQFDTYAKEYAIMARTIEKAPAPPKRMDNYTGEMKRIELHMHTKMSEMDGICTAEDIIKTAKRWGHKAIAITDHGNVQSFPEAEHTAKGEIKILYGVECYLVDDTKKIVENSEGQTFDDEFVVFDIETTGFSASKNKITEIGAVKIKNKEIIDRFSVFVNPEEKIPDKIVELTRITDEMVKDAETIDTILPKFLDFVGDATVVAHNAGFDTGFIRYNATEQKLKFNPTIIDTVNMSRSLFKELKNHKLNTLCEHLGVKLEGHHRAVVDAEATAEAFLKMLDIINDEKEINSVDEVNSLAGDVDPKELPTNHCIIFAKNTKAIRSLYMLVSNSYVKYFKRFPKMPKSEILQFREDLIIGSACEAGELYKAIVDGKDENTIKKIIDFYDYLEIQPLSNNLFMIDSDKYPNINTEEDLKNINRKIVELGEKYNKPVVATSDAHFINEEDDLVRKILLKGKGFADGDKDSGLYLKTTDEMLSEMSYLGYDKAYEVTVKNTNLVADMIEDTCPLSKEKCTPFFDHCIEDFIEICNGTATEMYGENIPVQVEERLKIERDSIIENGYTVLYMIAQKLVKKSNDDGYLVGSRGSVGSSFAATMAGITEVNPLPAHYICPECKYVDFESEVVANFAGNSGCDLPDAKCPKCGAEMEKWGHDIPFQTFLGFNADKEPDIDLNFSGDYQAKAHAYTEELFGKGHAYRAGTIGTLADKTAYGFIVKYYEEKGIHINRAEIQRIVNKAVGVKRSTGQHPGGIVVLPSDRDIYDFCPIQWPANDSTAALETTHFDYHSIDSNLLKLDILGHDDPTIIRMLEDITGLDAKKISLSDKGVMDLFRGLDSLKIRPEQIGGIPVGTLGVPEFGTNFTIGMVVDTKPQCFSDLVRISGLSHGTDVWLNNAQTLIKEGKASIAEVISTRDDIMTFLISKGMDKGLSFKIMESVRKGKGLTPEMEEAMNTNGTLPDWYIPSCKKIKYMFPKAHAVAYVMMAWRIAYFKVYYPLAYYCAFFSIRAKDFDYEIMCFGKDKLDSYIKEYTLKGMQATTKEKNTLDDMRIVQEMYARGFEFTPINLYKSKAKLFQIEDGKILPSFLSVQGLGESVAYAIEKESALGEYHSIDEFRERTKANKNVVEIFKEHKILKGIPESSQLSIFDDLFSM